MCLRLLLLTPFILPLTTVLEQLDLSSRDCYKQPTHHGNPIENVLHRHYIWTNATVPYSFRGVFEQRELINILLAIEAVKDASCLRFDLRTSEDTFLLITNTLGDGCWADTGRQNRGPTYMNLGSNCTSGLGTILHELMHVLGFLHQHSRPDRDQYLCIRYENIVPQPAVLYNYAIVKPWNRLAFPLPYDFESITHYTTDMYSVDPGRLPTMSPKYPHNDVAIGQRDHLTDYDVLAIHFLYCV